MTMDDTFAFYGGRSSTVEDVVVKGFVNYTYTSALAIGYGGAPNIQHLRFEDVHFVTNQNKFAVWIQLTPAYFTGKGYTSGQKSSEGIVLDDFKFVNTTFENDGGHIYIDGGKDAVDQLCLRELHLRPCHPARPDDGRGCRPRPVQE